MVTFASDQPINPQFVTTDLFAAMMARGQVGPALPIFREAVYPAPANIMDRIRMEARARTWLEERILKDADQSGAALVILDDRNPPWNVHEADNKVRIQFSASAARLNRPLAQCLKALS